MTYQRAAISDDLYSLPKLPAWVTAGRAETPETVAFRSGAAFMVLDTLVTDSKFGAPVKLLVNRLALKTATTTSKLEGRLAREVDIRDAYHLTPAGEARGPDGDALAFWRDASRLRMNDKNWHRGLGDVVGPNFADEAVGWLASGADRLRTHGPLVGCTSVMRAVLEADDRAERLACLLSDVVLARALNWATILPVSAQRLTKAMLRDLIAEGQGGALTVQWKYSIPLKTRSVWRASSHRKRRRCVPWPQSCEPRDRWRR